jgi:hypothetical protein
MADEVRGAPEASVTTLVSGIISDAQELFKQQVALIRSEIRDDLRKTKEGALALVSGAVVCLVAGLLFCFALVHLLHWLSAPPGTDPAAVPLWGWFAIVGGVLALAGGALVYAGVKKFQSFNPLPEQSVEGLKENLQWQTNRR